MFAKPDPDDLKPCPHMETPVSAWVDNDLTGLKLWYTRWHVANCARCAAAVPTLNALRGRLRRLPGPDPDEAALAPERRGAVESAWERADQASSESPLA